MLNRRGIGMLEIIAAVGVSIVILSFIIGRFVDSRSQNSQVKVRVDIFNLESQLRNGLQNSPVCTENLRTIKFSSTNEMIGPFDLPELSLFDLTGKKISTYLKVNEESSKTLLKATRISVRDIVKIGTRAYVGFLSIDLVSSESSEVLSPLTLPLNFKTEIHQGNQEELVNCLVTGGSLALGGNGYLSVTRTFSQAGAGAFILPSYVPPYSQAYVILTGGNGGEGGSNPSCLPQNGGGGEGGGATCIANFVAKGGQGGKGAKPGVKKGICEAAGLGRAGETVEGFINVGPGQLLQFHIGSGGSGGAAVVGSPLTLGKKDMNTEGGVGGHSCGELRVSASDLQSVPCISGTPDCAATGKAGSAGSIILVYQVKIP